jgi:hypothetical protein
MSNTEKPNDDWVINLVLQDLLSAATDFFEACPELREFKVGKQNGGVWLILPDGTKQKTIERIKRASDEQDDFNNVYEASKKFVENHLVKEDPSHD